MWALKVRILRFARANDRLPATLEELPPSASLGNTTNDGWGHPIVVSFAPDGTVTLTSYGRDGVPGGTGEDADIVTSFTAKTTNGSWADEQVPWVKPP